MHVSGEIRRHCQIPDDICSATAGSQIERSLYRRYIVGLTFSRNSQFYIEHSCVVVLCTRNYSLSPSLFLTRTLEIIIIRDTSLLAPSLFGSCREHSPLVRKLSRRNWYCWRWNEVYQRENRIYSPSRPKLTLSRATWRKSHYTRAEVDWAARSSCNRSAYRIHITLYIILCYVLSPWRRLGTAVTCHAKR